ncbi:hypothetical protein EZS27_035089 [termite gut metagenome]|uniref:Uncharacterized protein n=1 Tax=termite gut metagenome TaxID=433724 RepID=A0A5J4Q0Z1_9ZZZZ
MENGKLKVESGELYLTQRHGGTEYSSGKLKVES